jgi:hypothetical protein
MKQAVIIVSLFCFLAPAAFADVIIFKDGTQLECKVKGVAGGQAGVEENGKAYYISMEKISEIIYVKKIKEDDTMKWIIGGSLVLMLTLGFSLALWGRNL